MDAVSEGSAVAVPVAAVADVTFAKGGTEVVGGGAGGAFAAPPFGTVLKPFNKVIVKGPTDAASNLQPPTDQDRWMVSPGSL